jgi:hypothetical protein
MEDFGEWSVEEFPQHANQEECLRDPKERGVKMPVKLEGFFVLK